MGSARGEPIVAGGHTGGGGGTSSTVASARRMSSGVATLLAFLARPEVDRGRLDCRLTTRRTERQDGPVRATGDRQANRSETRDHPDQPRRVRISGPVQLAVELSLQRCDAMSADDRGRGLSSTRAIRGTAAPTTRAR